VIDVWYHYPAQGQSQGPRPCKLPFETLDNVLMTPHASAWTDGLLPRRNRAIATNLNRLARGEPLINVVRPAV
jgi:phosphoglycerate dehydrogenase-like enzyme